MGTGHAPVCLPLLARIDQAAAADALPAAQRCLPALVGAAWPPPFQEADKLLALAGDAGVPDQPRFRDRAYGVNLIGRAFSLLGLGEYLRMMARALEVADIPFCVVDLPTGSGASTQDRCLADRAVASDRALPYAFTLYGLTANTQLDVALKQRWLPSASTYGISCWFWEMDRWPHCLRGTLALADEFWP